jgi:hypothetical protein
MEITNGIAIRLCLKYVYAEPYQRELVEGFLQNLPGHAAVKRIEHMALTLTVSAYHLTPRDEKTLIS